MGEESEVLIRIGGVLDVTGEVIAINGNDVMNLGVPAGPEVGRILEIALANNASCVVLAHNHPAGVCIPSSADIENTKRLFDLLAAVDIRLVEHYVIADDKYMPILHA